MLNLTKVLTTRTIVLRYLWTQGRIWRRRWCYECFGLSTCACRGWKLWNHWPTSWAQNIRHQGMISTLHIMSLWFGHGEQHNSVQTFSVCEVFVAQISSHIHRINNIYQHVHDPAQDNWRETNCRAFTLSSAHLEVWGQMVMAWKTLKGTMVPMDTPLLTPWTYLENSRVKSLSVRGHPKFAIVLWKPPENRTKMLATIRFLTIKSMVLSLYPVQ